MIGNTIGKYRIVEKLGRGGMGTVYKAIDETLDREVAIKVLNSGLEEDSDVMKRFRAEATTLAKLNHSQIATIYELARSDADLLMVMEFVRGETLEDLSKRCGPLPPGKAAHLLTQVLAALEYAHDAGIIHRDLKPANIMVTEQGAIKIMDFGIARVLGAERMTTDGSMMGTPAYMAPEQILGHELDGRADLYSIGVVFYHLLTGDLPFHAESAIAMIQKQVSDPPTPARTIRADLPDWCVWILDRAMAKAPNDRFQTAEAFRAALMKGLAGEAVETTTASAELATQPMAPQLSAVQPTGAVPAGSTTVVLRRKDYAVAGVLLAVLAIGVAVLALVALRRPAPIAVTPEPQPAAQVQPPPARPAAAPGIPRARAEAPQATVRAPLGARADTPNLTGRAAAKTDAPARGPSASVPPFVFDAKALVKDGDKQRERDSKVLLDNGKVTVTAQNEVIGSVPYSAVLGVSYSLAKQPLWNSPEGPAPIVRVEGGAFGFFKGDRHWVALRTKDTFVVLRVDAEQVNRVLAGLETHTGRKPERVIERKDDK